MNTRRLSRQKKEDPGRFTNPYVILLVLAVILCPGGRAGGSEAAAQADGYTSAAECGLCHLDLYQSWEGSFHARASTNPVFIDTLNEIESDYGREIRVLCLSCHSPTINVTMDYNLSNAISQEGVTCDFCHTVTSVDLGRKGMKLINDLGPVKAGPGREDSIPAHRTRKTPLLLESEFCAGCHQWTNDQGVAILDTYMEWESSFYRGEDIYCQFCHMPEILNMAVMKDGRVVDRPSRLHSIAGGHSQTQITTAVKLKLAASISGGRVEARTTVENFKGGHMLPTGLPSRMVMLELIFSDAEGNILDRKESVYHRVIGDARGKPLFDMSSWLLNATRVLSDTRIAPKEKRVEIFTANLPEGAESMTVEAKLSYRLQLAELDPPYLDYEIASAVKVVRASNADSDVVRSLFLALAILIFILIALIVFRSGLGREKERPQQTG